MPGVYNLPVLEVRLTLYYAELRCINCQSYVA